MYVFMQKYAKLSLDYSCYHYTGPDKSKFVPLVQKIASGRKRLKLSFSLYDLYIFLGK